MNEKEAEASEIVTLLILRAVDETIRGDPEKPPPAEVDHPYAEIELAGFLTAVVTTGVRSHPDLARGCDDYLAQVERYVVGECFRRYSRAAGRDVTDAAKETVTAYHDANGNSTGRELLGLFRQRVKKLRSDPFGEDDSAFEALVAATVPAVRDRLRWVLFGENPH